MRRILKDHFIPHHGNDYKPHFLRVKVVAGLLALIVVIEGLYLAQTLVIFPKSDYLAAIFATVLVDQTNEVRTGQSLAMLTPNPVLAEVARMKAEDMAAKSYFAHNAPDGKTPWYWFKKAGYRYIAAGENLAVNFTDSKDVTEAWLNSPSHRANIVNGNYTEIGIATAKGYYKGQEAVFVVEVFGRPASRATVAQVAPPSTTEGVAVTAQAKPIALTFPPTPVEIRLEEPAPPIATSVAGAEILLADEPIIKLAVEFDGANTSDEAKKPILAPKPAPLFAALLASPRHLATTFYLLLGAILLIAILLTIFVEIRIQHPHLVVGGFLLLFVLVGLSMANATMSFAQGAI